MAITDSFPVVDMGRVPAYPDVLPLNWVLLLRDGRKLTLARLAQHRTYGGLLNGAPFSPERDVTVALAQARDWDVGFHKNLIVIPAPIVKGLKPTPRDSHLARLGEIPWAYLPAVTTFAVFHLEPSKNSKRTFASALAVWWQSNFGIPTDGPPLDRLKSIQWSDHVEEWDP